MSVEVVVTCQSLRVEPEGDTSSSLNDVLIVPMTTYDATEFHGSLKLKASSGMGFSCQCMPAPPSVVSSLLTFEWCMLCTLWSCDITSHILGVHDGLFVVC